ESLRTRNLSWVPQTLHPPFAMNTPFTPRCRGFCHGQASLSLLLSIFALPLLALAVPTIPNPSFEANAAFANSPGYVIDNTAIIGWTGPTDRTGLNPAGGLHAIADNGAVPNGTR